MEQTNPGMPPKAAPAISISSFNERQIQINAEVDVDIDSICCWPFKGVFKVSLGTAPGAEAVRELDFDKSE